MFVCLYVCYSNNSESTGPNLMKFGGMIGHDPRNNRLDFGSDRVKGQGHEKVKNVFSRYIGQFASDLRETSAKMYTQFNSRSCEKTISGVGEGLRSTECPF